MVVTEMDWSYFYILKSNWPSWHYAGHIITVQYKNLTSVYAFVSEIPIRQYWLKHNSETQQKI